jgi:hypothetical protein
VRNVPQLCSIFGIHRKPTPAICPASIGGRILTAAAIFLFRKLHRSIQRTITPQLADAQSGSFLNGGESNR